MIWLLFLIMYLHIYFKFTKFYYKMACPKCTIGIYREVTEILIGSFANLHIYYPPNVTDLHKIWSKLIHHVVNERQKGV